MIFQNLFSAENANNSSVFLFLFGACCGRLSKELSSCKASNSLRKQQIENQATQVEK